MSRAGVLGDSVVALELRADVLSTFQVRRCQIRLTGIEFFSGSDHYFEVALAPNCRGFDEFLWIDTLECLHGDAAGTRCRER